jgi:mannose-1-phosphate guanylyltransferase
MSVRAWVLVLAGGEGRRLRELTRDQRGRTVPKQYFDFGIGRSLIARTLDRALMLARHDHVVTVVSAAHREWWERELGAIPTENIIVQPENRGTAAGILLPLLHIAAREPQATVIVLPSDHHVVDEAALAHSVAETIEALERHPHNIILLGMTPEEPDTEYGWVLPDAADGTIPPCVSAFVEKPARSDAIRLMGMGAVWNSFMFAGRVPVLIEMFHERLPELVEGMSDALARRSAETRLAELYRTLVPCDFSREVLQSLPSRLRVLAVPACGWTDLGTPERLTRVLGAAPVASAGTRSAA